MTAVVVGNLHVAAPAYERIGLRQRADAVTITVEAVAAAGRFGIRGRHGHGADDEGRSGAEQKPAAHARQPVIKCEPVASSGSVSRGM